MKQNWSKKHKSFLNFKARILKAKKLEQINKVKCVIYRGNPLTTRVLVVVSTISRPKWACNTLPNGENKVKRNKETSNYVLENESLIIEFMQLLSGEYRLSSSLIDGCTDPQTKIDRWWSFSVQTLPFNPVILQSNNTFFFVTLKSKS